jgi:hypothetical protein
VTTIAADHKLLVRTRVSTSAFGFKVLLRPLPECLLWVKSRHSAYTLSVLALLYSVVSGEYAGAAWFIWMPIVILAVLAPTMWWLAAK